MSTKSRNSGVNLTLPWKSNMKYCWQLNVQSHIDRIASGKLVAKMLRKNCTGQHNKMTLASCIKNKTLNVSLIYFY